MIIEKVRIKKRNMAIEGSFRLPALANLTKEDQIFVSAFVMGHAFIKEMERLFQSSYPTIKN